MIDNVVRKIKDAFEGIAADKKTVLKILSIVVILLAAAVLRIHESAKADISVMTEEQTAAAEETEEAGHSNGADEATYTIYVDISGAVNEPGVYQVASETRLYEVIDMAGGLAENADTDSVNRASFVEDGQKIIIPEKGAASVQDNSGTSEGVTSSGLININTASVDELKSLNGIGDVMAQRIVEYRTSKAFESKEDIMSVKGIGNGIYEKIKDDITI